MRKYRVLPIANIIEHYKQFQKIYPRIATIVITNYKFNFTFEPTVQLTFLDVEKNHPNFVTEKDVEKLRTILPDIRHYDLVLVGCDAGISRSPAVAMAIAWTTGDMYEWKQISNSYPYYNKDVYEFLVGRF